MRKKVKTFLVFLLISALAVSTCACSNDNNNLSEHDVQTIESLLSISEVSLENNIYSFIYMKDNDASTACEIIYSENNEAVRIREDSVEQIISNIFSLGTQPANTDYEFVYDFSDEEFRIYTDMNIEDGHLSIISYNIKNDEIILMIDGEEYFASDWLDEMLRNSGIIETMHTKKENLFNALNEIAVSEDDVAALSYECINSYFAQ